MVDLVKIRKKAKQKKEEDQPEAAAPRSEESPAEPSPVNDASEPTPAPTATAAPSETDRPPDAGRATSPDAAGGESGEGDAPAAAGESSPSTSKLERFKAEAGMRREQEIAEESEEEEGRLERLTFLVAGEAYAVDIEHIVEIVTPRAVTRIPNADPAVVGIVSLRGTIVTLVDVRRKLGHPPAGEADEETRIIIVEFRGEMTGFIVDRVLRVVKLAEEEIEPHPVVHATELDDSVRGVFRSGGTLTILLDLDKLLDHSAFVVSPS
jgi:purine-binding chemotaxis protein CheW